MNKFEQLIEYVINDEDDKAKELFHDIVVEKSRTIYEDLMREDEEEQEEEEEEEEIEEGHDLGGRASEELINDVEADVDADHVGMHEDEEEEEEDVAFDDKAETAGKDLTHDMEHDHDEADLEDRVVDLEDKLDELMAEFEAMMDDSPDMDDVEGIDDMNPDAMAMDDTSEMDENLMVTPAPTPDNMTHDMREAINLKAAPKPVTSEEGSVNKKSTYAANSGQAGMEGKPVRTGDSNAMNGKHDAAGAYSNTPKELIGKVQNTPATGGKSMTPATKPHLAQATGVNTRTPFPKA